MAAVTLFALIFVSVCCSSHSHAYTIISQQFLTTQRNTGININRPALQYHTSHMKKIRIRLKSDDFEDAFDELVDGKQKQNPKRIPSSTNDEDDYQLTRSNSRKKTTSPSSSFAGINKWEVVNRALVAGVFVAGIGAGITIDSAINTNPRDLASRDAIDRNAPNPKLCAAYGSSAMVLDQRIFVTFNPFNVYVTQADTKPGCVLRPSNVVAQLQKERSLLTDEEIEGCKNGFNTWAYIGDINNKPQLTCVFQSDDAQNEFLSNPKIGLGEDVYDDDRKKSSSNKNYQSPEIEAAMTSAAASKTQ